MAKNPAVMFYYDNFWGGVEYMTDREIVRYMRLLTMMWRNPDRGIPPTLFAEISEGSAEISTKFFVGENGNYYNERGKKTGEKAQEKTKKAVEANKVRWGKGEKVDPNGCPNGCPIINDIGIGIDLDPGVGVDVGIGVNVKSGLSKEQQARFNRFWAAYPRKVSKGQAMVTWKKLDPNDAAVELMVGSIERAKARDRRFSDPQYTPHASTWLNSAGWLDDYGAAIKQPGQSMMDSLANILKREKEAVDGS